MSTVRRHAITITLVAGYLLARQFAEPVADILAGFCVGWTAADISRSIIRRHTKERA